MMTPKVLSINSVFILFITSLIDYISSTLAFFLAFNHSLSSFLPQGFELATLPPWSSLPQTFPSCWSLSEIL